MKFEELTLIEDKRNNTFIEFEKELTKFKEYYHDADFDLNYADTDHLIITTENILEYTEKMHIKLCRYFNVKLTYVNRLNQQSARGHYLTIEYIYQPVDAQEQEIPWRSIKWL